MKLRYSEAFYSSEVVMTRQFTFANADRTMDFCPIFASNMDGVGTFSMAKVLQQHKMMTVITKSTTLMNGKQPQAQGYVCNH